MAAVYIDITFNKGIVTEINGKEFNEAGVNSVLSNLATEYGLESAEAIIANAKAAVSEENGKVCMKICNGTASPFAA